LHGLDVTRWLSGGAVSSAYTTIWHVSMAWQFPTLPFTHAGGLAVFKLHHLPCAICVAQYPTQYATINAREWVRVVTTKMVLWVVVSRHRHVHIGSVECFATSLLIRCATNRVNPIRVLLVVMSSPKRSDVAFMLIQSTLSSPEQSIVTFGYT
jgi:hypothetical protein